MDLYRGTIGVHYRFVFLGPEDEDADLDDTCRGQRNGLLGGAVPGHLSMVTGTHTGEIPFTVQWLEHGPGEPDPRWEDVVEVSFTPGQRDVVLSAFEEWHEIELPALGSHRVRYSARAMDAAHEDPGEDPPDEYFLQLWPAPPGPDAILRQTGGFSAYWHGVARELAPPPTQEEVAEAARLAEEKARREREGMRQRTLLAWWGGRLPSQRMLEIDAPASPLARRDRAVFDRIESVDDGTARLLARWLARRAFEIAGIADLDWAARALAALDAGEPPPIGMDEAFDMVVQGPGRHEARATTALVLADSYPMDRHERIHRPAFAVPALFSAADPVPLRALVATYDHAVATFHHDRDTLRAEFLARLP